jgi:hypothetical protein
VTLTGQRQWIGPEPHDLHRLLLAACCRPIAAAHVAWQRWLTECWFDDEDLGSYELAGMVVTRLGRHAGTGSIVARCRGWNRRAWLLSTMAVEIAERLRDYSSRHGIDITPVGDVLAVDIGLRFAGRSFPVRALEFHVRNGDHRDIEALRTIAMQGTAGAEIKSGRLPLSLRTDYRYPSLTNSAGRIVWLLSRNWRRYPSGRVRWILEMMAEAAAGDAARLGVEVADEAERFGTLAAVQEALEWIYAAELADDSVRAIRSEVAARRPSIVSRARLWRVRHPWTPQLLRRR